MIYKKPPAWIELPIDIRDFLHSLPDQFEVVPDGHVCVKWPSDCTKGRLEVAARNLSYNAETSEGAAKHMLRALAAIAPVEKKKRRVEIWRHTSGRMEAWELPIDPRSNMHGWTRVETATPVDIEW